MPRAVFLNASYRRGGVTDTILDEIAARFAERGFEVVQYKLCDLDLRFCLNCRACCQEPGPARGRCVLADDGNRVLDEVDGADWLVVGSPVNDFTVTAVLKLLMERMIGYVYWPWGMAMPKPRIRKATRKAVLVTSTAMPAFLARFFTRSLKDMRQSAKMAGFKSVLEYRVGMVAMDPRWEMPRALKDRIARDMARVVAH